MNEDTNASRVEKVNIQYDVLPNYCKECKLQGHAEEECRVLHPELRQPIHADTEIHDNRDTEIHNQLGTPVFRIGRHFKKWHPTNRTFPRQNQEEHIAGVTDVRISNSFIALNEEITVEDETRNTHPSTGISRKDMERVNGNEQHTITKTCEPETTKEWITKAFATQGKETKKHKDNNESKESAKGGISEEENAIADHDGLAREDRLVQLSKDKENEDHIVEGEMVVYNATLESDGRDLQGMLDQIAPGAFSNNS